jgi:hypothetical protein
LAITATHTVSFAGESSATLHAAVVGGISGAVFQTSSLYAIGDEYADATPVLAAPMEMQCATRSQCLVELIYKALLPVLAHAQTQRDRSEPPYVSVLLPMLGERYARAHHIDFNAIRHTLIEFLPGLDPNRLNLLPHQLGGTAELLRLRKQLAWDKGQRAILCGADSLVNTLTFFEMAEKGTLATQEHPDGVIPGEGAAAVLIERLPAEPEPGQHALAHIAGMASVPELHVGRAAQKPLKGAAQALRQAAASVPDILDRGSIMIAGRSQGVADDLEWLQVVRQLWPETLGEQERLAMMLGESDTPQPEDRPRPQRIDLSAATGEIGAASVPMQLAVACEQFRFENEMSRFGFAGARPLMVLENGDYPIRGALCLQPPHSAS